MAMEKCKDSNNEFGIISQDVSVLYKNSQTEKIFYLDTRCIVQNHINLRKVILQPS